MSQRTRAWRRSEAIAAILVSLWCGGASLAYIDQLTVTPASPTCTDEITIRLDGWFPDACFFITGTQSLTTPPYLRINVAEYDGSCGLIIVDYSESATVGPLPAGRHTVWGDELIDSDRLDGEIRATNIDVRCCPEIPGAVHGLSLEKTPGHVRLTWDDVVDTDAYIVYSDSDLTDGFDFIDVEGTVTSGAGGFYRPVPPGGDPPIRYFLVGANNACGPGPLR